MIKVVTKTLNLPPQNGKSSSFPEIKTEGKVDLNDFIKKYSSPDYAATLKCILLDLTEWMLDNLSQGKSVKIDGLGCFSPALRKINNNHSEDEIDSFPKQIYTLRKVKFRTEKRFKQRLANSLQITECDCQPTCSSKQFTSLERYEMAINYLKEHHFMRVADYAQLTGLLHDKAAKELKKWAESKEGDLTTQGNKTHKVYILKHK